MDGSHSLAIRVEMDELWTDYCCFWSYCSYSTRPIFLPFVGWSRRQAALIVEQELILFFVYFRSSSCGIVCYATITTTNYTTTAFNDGQTDRMTASCGLFFLWSCRNFSSFFATDVFWVFCLQLNIFILTSRWALHLHLILKLLLVSPFPGQCVLHLCCLPNGTRNK